MSKDPMNNLRREVEGSGLRSAPAAPMCRFCEKPILDGQRIDMVGDGYVHTSCRVDLPASSEQVLIRALTLEVHKSGWDVRWERIVEREEVVYRAFFKRK